VMRQETGKCTDTTRMEGELGSGPTAKRQEDR